MPPPKVINKATRRPIASPKNKVGTTITTSTKKADDSSTLKKDDVTTAKHSTTRSNTAQSRVKSSPKRIYGSNPPKKTITKKQVSSIVQETIVQDITSVDAKQESDKESVEDNKVQPVKEVIADTLTNDEKISSSSDTDSGSESSSESESSEDNGSESEHKEIDLQNTSAKEDSTISPIVCEDIVEERTSDTLSNEGITTIPSIVDENKTDNSERLEESKEVLLHDTVCTDTSKGEIGQSLLLPLPDKQVPAEQGSLIKELKKTMNITDPDVLTKAPVPFNKSLSRLPFTDFIRECSSPDSNTIIFTRQPDSWQFLSNHYMSDMNIDGITYFHVEGYYHAQKFIGNNKIFTHVRSVTAPRVAQARGAAETMTPDRKIEWDAGTRIKVMKRGILTKFLTNEALAKKLLATGNKKLVEVTESDSYWGCTADGKGSNMNGKILEKVRNTLQYITSNEV